MVYKERRMSLLVSKTETVDIDIYYVMKDGNLVFLKDGTPDSTKETFTFRKPSWADFKKMMSSSASIDGQGGMSMDPYKFMDVRIKTLLCKWTLKEDDGKDIPLTPENIDCLPVPLMDHLAAVISESMPALPLGRS
jgi:hypothetical protein